MSGLTYFVSMASISGAAYFGFIHQWNTVVSLSLFVMLLCTNQICVAIRESKGSKP